MRFAVTCVHVTAFACFALPCCHKRTIARAHSCSGVKYPLRWIQQIKAKSTAAAQWRVLVDAAAYVPTQPLDLRQVSPDFVSLSFYKMFGYPTVSQQAAQLAALVLLQLCHGQPACLLSSASVVCTERQGDWTL